MKLQHLVITLLTILITNKLNIINKLIISMIPADVYKSLNCIANKTTDTWSHC